MTTDNQINALRPGGRVILSSANGCTVAAERSCDGRTIRIVRENSAGFVVIKSVRF